MQCPIMRCKVIIATFRLPKSGILTVRKWQRSNEQLANGNWQIANALALTNHTLVDQHLKLISHIKAGANYIRGCVCVHSTNRKL